jgi:Leucine-rich repeat (LRR) protein
MEETRVDVSNCLLTDLSHLSSFIRELRCSKNKIVSLECISHLIHLNNLGCSFTHIENFVGCPSNVKKIVAAFCKIESFEGLPKEMDTLYVSYNRLKTFDHCPSVKILDVSCNLFENIHSIPDGIEELCISNNHLLKELPKKWPKSIKILRLSGCNNITDESYKNFPNWLHLLEVSKNSDRCVQFVDKWLSDGIREVII